MVNLVKRLAMFPALPARAESEVFWDVILVIVLSLSFWFSDLSMEKVG